MIARLKRYWIQLRDDEPGYRFRNFYAYRRQRRSGSFSWGRLFVIVFSILLILVGLAIGWLPGPGGFIGMIGLAILATEFHWLARVLDWGERKVRQVLRR